jgi:hypothetical protein
MGFKNRGYPIAKMNRAMRRAHVEQSQSVASGHLVCVIRGRLFPNHPVELNDVYKAQTVGGELQFLDLKMGGWITPNLKRGLYFYVIDIRSDDGVLYEYNISPTEGAAK